MDSRIDPLKQSFLLRKAEENDAHHYIKRHDPDFQKNRKKSQDHFEDHDEDMTNISVQSLINFLKGLIRETNDDSPKPDKPETNINPSMKPAISAYGKQEKAADIRYTYLNDEEEYFRKDQIHRLINDLTNILDEDIQYISLLNGEGFIDSIEKTVAKIKSL